MPQLNLRSGFLIVALIVLAIAIRLLPHMPNAAPVAALALFAGFLTRNWPVGAMAALVVMTITDLVVGVYDWRVQLSVYACLSLYALMGPLVARLKMGNIVPAALLAAITGGLGFYLITNFMVWAVNDYYPHTWAGLVENYTLALPFYRATFIGDLLWTGVFFGGYVASQQMTMATANNS